MRGVHFLCCVASLAFSPLLANSEEFQSAEMRVGMAQLDITPSVWMRLCGTFAERLSTGTHDPLMVRAIVFSQGGVVFAIAGCDLAMISPAVASQARIAIVQ